MVGKSRFQGIGGGCAVLRHSAKGKGQNLKE